VVRQRVLVPSFVGSNPAAPALPDTVPLRCTLESSSYIQTVVVLAAGQGKRMKSDLPKVLHPVCGRAMLLHVLGAAAAVDAARTVVVLGHGHDQVEPRLPAGCEVALQPEQNGTGHAVLCAAEHILPGLFLVLAGDTPLITGELVRGLVDHHRHSGASATVLTMEPRDPAAYGRVVRDAAGDLVRIVEHRDANPEERELREVNSGMYVLPAPLALEILSGVGRDNEQGEIYLTDVIAGLRLRGERVAACLAADADTVMGVNSPDELAEAERLMEQRR
jgi:bifunctional UDP-N-acetylglucosamine pyrophosphorylase/glucosamine-1-phosphate N-acetyltransferase